MLKYEESKTTQIMMATVHHVTSSSRLRKFQTDGFLSDGVYKHSVPKVQKTAHNYHKVSACLTHPHPILGPNIT